MLWNAKCDKNISYINNIKGRNKNRFLGKIDYSISTFDVKIDFWVRSIIRFRLLM